MGTCIICSQMPCEVVTLLHKHVSIFEGTEAAASAGSRLLQCLKPLWNSLKISFIPNTSLGLWHLRGRMSCNYPLCTNAGELVAGLAAGRTGARRAGGGSHSFALSDGSTLFTGPRPYTSLHVGHQSAPTGFSEQVSLSPSIFFEE